MVVFPNCKINLGLYVTHRRPDGYHDLETIFIPLPFHDSLEIIQAHEDHITTYGKTINGDKENNLVWKALMILRKDFPDQIKPISISLLKYLPMGAGLGGGSADGAWMLRLLDQFFSLQLSEDELLSYALRLGSDCPFFIKNKPCFATGRGERLNPINLNLKGYSIQLICPELHISTAAAFTGIQPVGDHPDLKLAILQPIQEWKKLIQNNFESTVFPQYPALQEIKDQLYQSGAAYASMSGTGSSVYGIFPKDKKARIITDLNFEEFYTNF